MDKKLYSFFCLLYFALPSCGSNFDDSPQNRTSSTNRIIVSSDNIKKGKELFTKCVGCHGSNGEKHALGKSAIIQGQEKEGTIVQLTEYSAGFLNQYGMGGLMQGQVRNFSDSDIRDVASYIESLLAQ